MALSSIRAISILYVAVDIRGPRAGSLQGTEEYYSLNGSIIESHNGVYPDER
jgi:hypothetical protein